MHDVHQIDPRAIRQDSSDPRYPSETGVAIALLAALLLNRVRLSSSVPTRKLLITSSPPVRPRRMLMISDRPPSVIVSLPVPTAQSMCPAPAVIASAPASPSIVRLPVLPPPVRASLPAAATRMSFAAPAAASTSPLARP